MVFDFLNKYTQQLEFLTKLLSSEAEIIESAIYEVTKKLEQIYLIQKIDNNDSLSYLDNEIDFLHRLIDTVEVNKDRCSLLNNIFKNIIYTKEPEVSDSCFLTNENLKQIFEVAEFGKMIFIKTNDFSDGLNKKSNDYISKEKAILLEKFIGYKKNTHDLSNLCNEIYISFKRIKEEWDSS